MSQSRQNEALLLTVTLSGEPDLGSETQVQAFTLTLTVGAGEAT